MSKKFIAVILAVLTVMSLFAVTASAKEYYYENFENVTPSYSNAKAHLYISIPEFADGTSTAKYEVSDGMIHYEKSSYPQSEQVAIGNKVPETRLNFDSSVAGNDEVFIEMDFMFGENAKMTTGGELISYMYVHDKRFLINICYQGLRHFSYASTATKTLSKGVWYSGLLHVKLTDGEVDVYQKEKSADKYVYLQTIPLETRTSDNYYLQLYGDYRKDIDLYVDNVKIYDGINSKGGSFLMNGEKIESTAQITEGTLSVNTEVFCGDVPVENKVFSQKQIYPVLTVFDANGRLVDCKVDTDFGLGIGTNDISIDYDTNNFYEDVQGGYVGFYFWKDMISVRPVVKPIELN